MYYVEALIAADTVNTLPPDTYAAYRDHGNPEVRIEAAIAGAGERLVALERTGVSLAEVTAFLEEDGVAKFAASYRSLLGGIEAKMGSLAAR